MTTPTTEPTTAQVDAALIQADGPTADDYAITLAAEVRRLRAELAAPITEESLRRRNGGSLPVGKGCEIAVAGTTADLAAHSELHRYLLKCTLREGDEREQATTMDLLQELHARCVERGEEVERLTDEHTELGGKAEIAWKKRIAAEAKLDALVAAGDAMARDYKSFNSFPTWTTVDDDNLTAWESAKSGAQVPDGITEVRGGSNAPHTFADRPQVPDAKPWRVFLCRPTSSDLSAGVFCDVTDIDRENRVFHVQAPRGADVAELMRDKARLDSRMIKMTFPADEWGHTSCVHHDIDLRARIDAAMEGGK